PRSRNLSRSTSWRGPMALLEDAARTDAAFSDATFDRLAMTSPQATRYFDIVQALPNPVKRAAAALRGRFLERPAAGFGSEDDDADEPQCGDAAHHQEDAAEAEIGGEQGADRTRRED